MCIRGEAFDDNIDYDLDPVGSEPPEDGKARLLQRRVYITNLSPVTDELCLELNCSAYGMILVPETLCNVVGLLPHLSRKTWITNTSMMPDLRTCIFRHPSRTHTKAVPCNWFVLINGSKKLASWSLVFFVFYIFCTNNGSLWTLLPSLLVCSGLKEYSLDQVIFDRTQEFVQRISLSSNEKVNRPIS